MRLDEVGLDEVRQGNAGKAQRGVVRTGRARRVKAMQARLGMSGHGGVSPGKAVTTQ